MQPLGVVGAYTLLLRLFKLCRHTVSAASAEAPQSYHGLRDLARRVISEAMMSNRVFRMYMPYTSSLPRCVTFVTFEEGRNQQEKKMKTTPDIWFRFVFHIASIALKTYTLRVGDGRLRCLVGITEKPCDARFCC